MRVSLETIFSLSLKIAQCRVNPRISHQHLLSQAHQGAQLGTIFSPYPNAAQPRISHQNPSQAQGAQVRTSLGIISPYPIKAAQVTPKIPQHLLFVPPTQVTPLKVAQVTHRIHQLLLITPPTQVTHRIPQHLLSIL